jgi:hypothetical protein
MKKYFIIYNREWSNMISLVEKYMNEGWVPQGGVCWAEGCFYQAMVKKV